MIILEQYPNIKMILWDWHTEQIDEKDAFELIETRWRYLEHEDLTPEELVLIEKLKNEYGDGTILAK